MVKNLDDAINKMQELQKNMREVEKLLEPKLHVCTQSGKNIVPVDYFFADGTTNQYFIMASHRGNQRWSVLGAYKTQERALQVYSEMLQCPKNEIYVMPKE